MDVEPEGQLEPDLLTIKPDRPILGTYSQVLHDQDDPLTGAT